MSGDKHELRSWSTIVRRLTSRWCFSWQVYLSLVALGIGTALSWGSRGAQELGHYLFVEAVADAAIGMVVLVAAVSHVRTAVPARWRLAVVVAVWVVVGAGRALVFAAFDPDDSVRWTNANALIPMWALVLIYIFAAYDEARERTRQAAAVNAALREVTDTTEATLENERNALVDALQTKVAAEIVRLETLVRVLARGGRQSEFKELADSVAAFSKNVVREASHQLRVEEVLARAHVSLPRVPDQPRHALPSAYLRARQPIFIPMMLITLKGVSVSLLQWDPPALARIFFAFACMFAVMWGGRWLIERFVRRPSAVELILSTTLVVLSAGVGMAGIAVTRGNATDPALLPLPSIILFVIGVFIAARLVVAAQLQWADVTTDLDRANVALEAANENLRGDLRRVRSQLAEVLHGPVQGRLAAASMALRMYAEAGEEGRPADLARTVAMATALLDEARTDVLRLGQSEASRWASVDDGVADIATTWSGLLVVEWTTHDTCYRDSALIQATIDMVAELVTNASRHGDARTIMVHVAGRDASTIDIVAIDDGSGPSGQLVAGQGLGAAERSGGSWEIDADECGRTRVRVTLGEQASVISPR